MDIMSFLTQLPTPVFWLLFSGIVFFTMAVIILVRSYFENRDELMNAFLGFLVGMSAFHLLGGFSMLFENPILMYVASFGAMTGSAFIVKFPLTAILDRKIRQVLFTGALALAWIFVAWMFISAQDPMNSMKVASIS